MFNYDRSHVPPSSINHLKRMKNFQNVSFNGLTQIINSLQKHIEELQSKITELENSVVAERKERYKLQDREFARAETRNKSREKRAQLNSVVNPDCDSIEQAEITDQVYKHVFNMSVAEFRAKYNCINCKDVLTGDALEIILDIETQTLRLINLGFSYQEATTMILSLYNNPA